MRPEEKKLIATNGLSKDPVKEIPWRLILSKPPVWALIVCHFCHNWGTFILLTWMPTYYNQVSLFSFACLLSTQLGVSKVRSILIISDEFMICFSSFICSQWSQKPFYDRFCLFSIVWCGKLKSFFFSISKVFHFIVPIIRVLYSGFADSSVFWIT